MDKQGNDETRNANADLFNPLQPGADRFVSQFTHRFVRGQANVEFVSGRHHSSLTTGVGIRAAVIVIALVSFDFAVWESWSLECNLRPPIQTPRLFVRLAFLAYWSTRLWPQGLCGS